MDAVPPSTVWHPLEHRSTRFQTRYTTEVLPRSQREQASKRCRVEKKKEQQVDAVGQRQLWLQTQHRHDRAMKVAATAAQSVRQGAGDLGSIVTEAVLLSVRGYEVEGCPVFLEDTSTSPRFVTARALQHMQESGSLTARQPSPNHSTPELNMNHHINQVSLPLLGGAVDFGDLRAISPEARHRSPAAEGQPETARPAVVRGVPIKKQRHSANMEAMMKIDPPVAYEPFVIQKPMCAKFSPIVNREPLKRKDLGLTPLQIASDRITKSDDHGRPLPRHALLPVRQQQEMEALKPPTPVPRDDPPLQLPSFKRVVVPIKLKSLKRV